MDKKNLSDIVTQVQKSFKNDKRAKKIGLGSALKDITPEDCIKMPPFWVEGTCTPGLPFGRMVLISGGSDSGKTSMAIQAMKAAQEQDVICIYAESELKTSAKDLEAWGVKSDNVIMVQSTIAEELFDLVFRSWDAVFSSYPDAKVLLIIDSLGGVVSLRDSELDLTEQSQMPGGKGKINRLGINKLIAKMNEDNAAVLLISYVYDAIGMGHGKITAGGNALSYFASLSYQTQRKAWVEVQRQGKKVRIGADCLFKLQKNHINKSNVGPKEALFRITSEGIEYIKEKGKDEEAE